MFVVTAETFMFLNDLFVCVHCKLGKIRRKCYFVKGNGLDWWCPAK
jgi:hypothetical protein